jgi:hypothetical protein
MNSQELSFFTVEAHHDPQTGSIAFQFKGEMDRQYLATAFVVLAERDQRFKDILDAVLLSLNQKKYVKDFFHKKYEA